MILDEILKNKREEVAAERRAMDSRRLQDLLLDAPAPRPFVAALRRGDGRVGLIAEIKKASPSAGVIQPDFDPARQARGYEAGGADCLSVLTDAKYFQGGLNDLRIARAATARPCLRKDFIVDEFQIMEARAAGADAILLIVAALTPPQIVRFSDLARGLGMSVLVEVHTEAEMETALSSGAELIGINSRNLKNFEVDLASVVRVARLAPAHVTLVGESGIKTRADVDRLRAAGVRAILVGETLMRSGDVSAAIRDMVG